MNRFLNPRGLAIATAIFLALHLWGRHELHRTQETRHA